MSQSKIEELRIQSNELNSLFQKVIHVYDLRDKLGNNDKGDSERYDEIESTVEKLLVCHIKLPILK